MSTRLVLSNPQQYLLQIFMNRGVLDQFAFKEVFASILTKFNILKAGEEVRKEVYANFLREINDAIKHYNIEIQRGVCELTGYTFYCLVRLFDSCSIGKLSSLYSSTELKVFKIILTLVLESDEGSVDLQTIGSHVSDEFEELSTQAQAQSQVAAKVPTHREIRCIIDKFIKNYWIMEVLTQTNLFTLHSRCLIELAHYITEITDPEVLSHCYQCKKILLVGIRCQHCSSKFHRGCAKEIFSNQRDCLSCKARFSEEQVEQLKDEIVYARNAYQEKIQRSA